MLLAAFTDYFDLNKLMGLLPNKSDHGKEIDHMLNFCHWFMAILFVGWTAYFLYTIFRFHQSRHPRADYHGVRSHVSTHIEASVVIIEAVILLGFALPLWGKRVNEIDEQAKAGAEKIRAIGFQFGWFLHYAGKDGIYGRQSTRFIEGQNELGIDPNDPGAADDIVVKNEMYLVNGKPVVIRVTSRDVIHGFAIHEMRVQQDAMPGTEAPMWFRPVETSPEDGWQIICAQLCGSGHSQMAARYHVKNEKDFNAWYAEKLEGFQNVLKLQAEALKKNATAEATKAGEKKEQH